MKPIKTYRECCDTTVQKMGVGMTYTPNSIETEAAELYAAQFRTERLTDEQIDAMFPLHNSSGDYLQYNAARREAARTIRDLIQGGGK